MATNAEVMPQALRWADEPTRTASAEEEAKCATIPSTPATCAPEQPEHPEASEEEDAKALPSVGSQRHGSGCLPCAWFWKPQGCLNGAACLRCHLCPAGELKRRKGEQKAKRAAARAESPDSDEEQEAQSELPSVGSRLHATGQCKPCAWFWKAEGCRNAQSCGHCHLCPAGEAKARKQKKVAALRAKEPEPEMVPVMYQAVQAVQAVQVPMQYPTLLTPWSNMQQAHAAAKMNMCPGCTYCSSIQPCTFFMPREAGERRTAHEMRPFAPPVPPPQQPPQMLAQQTQQAPQPPQPTLPSRGSALHAEGQCAPCAWFWKAQGCHHGAECGRCHLCPASEIKLRRKAKAMAKDQLKTEMAEPRTLPSQHPGCALEISVCPSAVMPAAAFGIRKEGASWRSALSSSERPTHSAQSA
ncbi:unnamed protein product [Effrenium voratum]|nr:unnamed protein product [Effrenium voratum]